MKDKEKLKYYHIPKKTKKTQQLNVMWDPGLDPETEKKTLWEKLVKFK